MDDLKPSRHERRFRRIPQNLSADLRLLGLNTSTDIPIRGVLTDMGAAGVHILLGSAYHRGTRFEVVVSLNGEIVTFCAMVRHVRWYSSTPGMTFGHGMQITEIEEESLLAIVRYVTDEMSKVSRGLGIAVA
ncbi:MAG: hypothetical protein P4L33_09390 [Capsulimonadaceae bacterium]|nr:hypothetical protein [Capsulimonadaceae bacterium]